MPATLRRASPKKLQNRRLPRQAQGLGAFLERTAVRCVNDQGQDREEQTVMTFRWINSGVLPRLVVLAVACAVVVALAAAGTASAAPSTPPGGDAAYQVELSGNVPAETGGGSWFWLELDKDGGGIYAGSDCAHGGGGASADRGSLSWEQQGD